MPHRLVTVTESNRPNNLGCSLGYGYTDALYHALLFNAIQSLECLSFVIKYTTNGSCAMYRTLPIAQQRRATAYFFSKSLSLHHHRSYGGSHLELSVRDHYR